MFLVTSSATCRIMTCERIVDVAYLDILATPLQILRSADCSRRSISPATPSPPSRGALPCVENGIPRCSHGGRIVCGQHSAEFSCKTLFKTAEEGVSAGEEDIAEEGFLLRWVGESIHYNTFNNLDETGLVHPRYARLENDFRDADPFNIQVDLYLVVSECFSVKRPIVKKA